MPRPVLEILIPIKTMHRAVLEICGSDNRSQGGIARAVGGDSRGERKRSFASNMVLYNTNNNNNKSIYIAPWFQVTLFKGAVTSKKTIKKLKVKIYKYII